VERSPLDHEPWPATTMGRALDVLPAGLARRHRVVARLELAALVVDRGRRVARVEPDDLLLEVRAIGGCQELPLRDRLVRRRRELDAGAPSSPRG
jgi:hypothetical protein